MIKQHKGKQWNKLPTSKIPRNNKAVYASIKRDGAYVQIHINQDEQTVRFFTSGDKEFYLEKAARGFLFAVAKLNQNEIILEAEYNYGCEGKLGARWNASGKLTTYRTNFKHGIPTVGTSNDVFRVFDYVDKELEFVSRVMILNKMRSSTTVEFVKHTLMPYGVAMLKAKELVLEGWEGMIAKFPTHKYQPGKRTNDVIKLKFPPKMFVTVLAELEGQNRLKGMIGSLKCETPEGKRFNVGSGFEDKDREVWGYYVGRKVLIEYESLKDGVPQQPTIKL